MKLSLCIAVYNEAEFLHYPLESCIDWVDEVIIVDGGSTDATTQIAKSYGRKVHIIKTDNPPMFHINKQKAIEAAKGEWVLQLDADEQVSEALKNEILTIVNNEQGIDLQTVAYWVPRKNYFLGRFLTKGGVYPDRTIRLYRRGVAHFPCKEVHENVEITRNEGEKVGVLKQDLLHYADPTFSRYLKRWDRYTTLDAQRAKDQRLGFFRYFVVKPNITFWQMYLRHRGFLDGFSGFVFALFSSIRFWVIYIKWYQLQIASKSKE